MIRVMDMSTGKILDDEFGRYEEEVLNAGWLPPQPELQLGLQEVHSTVQAKREIDAASYLDQIYRNQE
ncbi:MAG TPA: hypothetical protein VF816_07140 [Rhodocyclaceae bacterium]